MYNYKTGFGDPKVSAPTIWETLSESVVALGLALKQEKVKIIVVCGLPNRVQLYRFNITENLQNRLTIHFVKITSC